MSFPQPPNNDYEFNTAYFLRAMFIKIINGHYRYVQENSNVCELLIEAPKEATPYKRGLTEVDLKPFYSELTKSDFLNPRIILIETKGGFLHAPVGILHMEFDLPRNIDDSLKILSKIIDDKYPLGKPPIRKCTIMEKIRKVLHGNYIYL